MEEKTYYTPDRKRTSKLIGEISFYIQVYKREVKKPKKHITLSEFLWWLMNLQADFNKEKK